MISIEKVNEYFNCHLQSDIWQNADETSKFASLTMANLDVSGELNEKDLEDGSSLEVSAVAEQAIYLLTSPEAVKSSNSIDVVSESIDGFGSVSYEPKSTGKKFIASRAKTFIDRRKRQLLSNSLIRG
jgi:hypothetical protein